MTFKANRKYEVVQMLLLLVLSLRKQSAEVQGSNGSSYKIITETENKMCKSKSNIQT
jgi:hypothetical protein